jgi:ubiquinone/menaquinone biosynthesis C-methylase UbiE
MDTIKQYWEKATPMQFKDEKWSYEKRRQFRYELQDYMHDAIGFDKYKGKRVLEVGCGSGIDLLEFARNGAICYGIDLTENAINMTLESAKQTHKTVIVSRASATSIPYDNAFFDTVWSFGVLHHIPEIEIALGEIKRVLKPDGEVIAMLYNKDSLLYAYSIYHLHKDNGIPEEKLASQFSERIEGCPYTKVYSREEAISLFSKYFRNVEVKTYYNVVDTPEQRKVKLDGDLDHYGFGWHHIVKAIK